MPAASKPAMWTPGTHSPLSTGLPCLCPTQRTLHRSAETFHRATWLRFSDRTDEYTFRWHLMQMKCSTVLLFFDLVFRSRRPTSLHWRHRFWQEILVLWQWSCSSIAIYWFACFFTPRPHYVGEILKRRCHFRNASNVFRPHYDGEIEDETTRAEKSHDYRGGIVFEKLRFQNVSRSHENEKPAFSNSSGLKSVFEKFRFHDGLVWTVDLTVEVKLVFNFFLFGRGLN